MKQGDFIECRDGSVGRIDQILTHEPLPGNHHLFVSLSCLSHVNQNEPWTGLAILEAHEHMEMIGLPSLRTCPLYILPTAEVNGRMKLGELGKVNEGCKLLHVHWDVSFF